MITASRYRLWVLYAVVAALLISLGARLWYVQVMNTRAYASLAAQDQTQQVVVPPVRGQILDDIGQPLVDNRTALVVSVNIARLAQRADEHAVLVRLAHLLHMRTRLVREKVQICTAGVKPPCWAGSPYQPVPVNQGISDKVALQIMENRQQFPDVTAQVQPVVDYPRPDHANPAQVLGYLRPINPQEVKQRHLTVTGFSGVNLVGQAGLEEQYDKELRGTPGIQRVRVNAQGVVTGTISQTPAKAGDDLVTSINAPLQADVQKILANAIHKAFNAGNRGATSGTAVVMTTKGRVVATASYPSYNPSVWTGGISTGEFNYLFGTGHGEPILNRVTQGEYPPGSTFKVTTTAAAVAEGYSLYGNYNCPGSVNIGGHKFANDGNPNLGPMSFHEALVVSCDTVYYQLGYDMWLRDHPAINWSPAGTRRCSRCRRRSWPGASAVTPASTCPSRPGYHPDQAVALLLLEAVQALLVLARQPGRLLHPADRIPGLQDRVRVGAGPGRDRRDRAGLRDRHAAAARRRLRGPGQRRHPVQPADRRGPDQPRRRGGQEDQPASDPAPAGVRHHPRLHQGRAAGGGDLGHRGRRVRRLPAQQGLRGGQDRHSGRRRYPGELGVRLVRPV